MAVTVETLIRHALFGQRIQAPLRVVVVLVPEEQKHGGVLIHRDLCCLIMSLHGS